MTSNYTTRREVKIDMRKYVKNMTDEFPLNIDKYRSVTRPATCKLFKVDVSKPLNENNA